MREHSADNNTNQEIDKEPINILLVDDQAENLLATAELLEAPGYNIVQARSGSEALRYLLKMDFAVILLDIQMPGMNGFETATRIRERLKTKNTPIIFVTAMENNAEYIEKGYSLGAVDYLTKPIVPSFLKTKVSVFVELHRMRVLETQAKEKLAVMTKELARSNDELEQFAYAASHDLQEPLRNIKGFAELLAKRYKGRLDDQADEFITFITEGADRMRNLITGLLAYSRITTQGKPLQAVDCNRLMEDTLNMIQKTQEDARAVITFDQLPTLKADAVQIKQLFQNLILNAIKFKGRNPPVIHITAEPSGEPSEKTWLFSFSDNGIGIDPDQTERIFRMFQRLHKREAYQGDGLGLTICKKIVERHGGRIWVESERGKGSTFYVTLPGVSASDTYRL